MLIRVLALVAIVVGWSAGIVTDASAQGGLSDMAQRFYRMGRDALNNRDWAECIEHFTQVVEIDSEFLDAYMDLAYCQEEMKQYRDAADTYREALKVAPDDRKPDIMSRLAYVYATGGQLDKAVKIYEDIVDMTPNDKVALEGLAYTYRNLGQLPESIMAYQRALELAPNDIDLLGTLGELCDEADMQEQAATYYERWVSIEPTNVGAWRRYAVALTELKVCDKGAQAWDRVIELDDTNPGDKLNQALLHGKCGNQQEALATLQEYAKQRPDDPQVVCRILFLYEDIGDPVKGIREVGNAGIERFPDDGCVLLGYARLLDKWGTQLEKAKEFDQAIEKYRLGMAKCQKALADPDFGANAAKQITRFEQLINRAEKLKLQAEQGYE